MKNLLRIALILACALTSFGSTRTLTVLGDLKVKTQWDGYMPKAMKAEGVETNVTGIIIRDGKLIPTFGFDFVPSKKLASVRVEDVTGKTPVLMVEDFTPAVVKGHWKGNSSPRDITPEGVPWLFTAGDSLTVYRFTVQVDGDETPIVIYQPSVFRESSKVRLRNIAASLQQR